MAPRRLWHRCRGRAGLPFGNAAHVLRPSALAGRISDACLLHRLTFHRFDVAGEPAGPQEFVLRQFPAPDVDAVLGTGFF